MKREILFKALKDDMTDCRWVEGMLIYDKDLNPRIQENIAVALFTTCIKDTECQFTGLTDINRIKVFEGDIVDIIHPCWTTKCKTKYMDGAFWFIELDNPNSKSQIREDKFLKQGWKIEVIGNIHDNPELLNQ